MLWCTNCRGSAKAVGNIPALSSFPLFLWDLLSVPVLVSSCSRLSGKLRFIFCIPKGLPSLLPPSCCPAPEHWSLGLTGALCCRWECWNSWGGAARAHPWALWGNKNKPWCVCEPWEPLSAVAMEGAVCEISPCCKDSTENCILCWERQHLWTAVSS